MTSRLMFHCQFCDLKASRSDSYVALPNELPSFTDICPRCHSDDLEIFDEVLVERAAPRPWVDYGGDDGADENIGLGFTTKERNRNVKR